ncbi:MAG: hypothetical protein ACT4OO_05750, partial [Nitrospiraceae bacterium]
MTRQVALLAAVALLFGCSTVPKSFSPLKPIAPLDVSHSTFEEILRTHVVDGRVNYPGIQTDGRFERYLEQLDRINPNTLPTSHDRLAFWINA